MTTEHDIPTDELTTRARTGWLIYQDPTVVAAFDPLAAHGFWLNQRGSDLQMARYEKLTADWTVTP